MKRIFLVLILISAGLNTLFAQSETTEFNVDGIKVIFKPTFKNVVSARIYFRGGVTNYTAGQAGIEKLALGAVLNCGTSKHTANAFKDAADYYDILLDNSSNYDYSDIELSCIATYFDKGWSLLAEAINTPVFDAAELQLYKSKVISDIKQGESSPDKYIDDLTMKNAFEGTPYATDPDGTEETINSFSPDQLKAYYSMLLNKNRMFIVIAGKISKEDIIAKVKAAFGNLPSVPYTAVTLTAPVWNDNKLLAEPRNLSTNYINGIMNAPVMTSADYLPYRLAISTFSGSLFSELRTRRNLSYAPGAYTANLLMPYAVMYISTTNPGESVSVMVDQLSREKAATISEKGMEQIRATYITSNYMKLQSSSSITSNLGIAEVMGGWSYFESIPARLDQVTAQDINRALKKYAIGVRWSYLGDPEAANSASAAFGMPIK